MPTTKHIIDLTDTDRKYLTDIVKKGSSPAKTILRANILPASDNGLEATINRKKRETSPVPAKVTGDIEAHIIALACGDSPEGYSRWSIRLIAEKCVKLNYTDSISNMTVFRILKKTNLSLI